MTLDGVELLPYHRIGADKYVRLDRKYRLLTTDAPSRARLDAIADVLAASGVRVGRGGT